MLYELGETIGTTTNNVAEYKAVIAALTWACQEKEAIGSAPVRFFADSLLIVSQINGVYQVKNEQLRVLLYQIRILEKTFGRAIVYAHIPREKNKQADRLVNMALDKQR